MFVALNLWLISWESNILKLKMWQTLVTNFGSASSPLCAWEPERVCSQTQLCQLRCLMTILDNYMFRSLLAIFRLSLRELKVLLIMCARVMERSLHPGCVIVNYYVQCGGVLCTLGGWWLVSRLKLVWRGVFLFFLGVVLRGGPKWPRRHSPLPVGQGCVWEGWWINPA